ncbi:putative colanic acid biosynthesis acetyltransferase WcaF [Silvibacterium bohemicum]|uniref:Putative colanic acid biosynthesis acetyltransferase WcaF n=1 Tax=Silvibacterium bohemicum TaxID=1577686 RepID=A0A841JQK5_9BACT|nr:WcaF family extracellular polysaccharide biosynthesis acetyltransferase [Silvibacterium bohemicum]MBB6143672.1 putative colanic acid biosynthesis acetyltransferase WcaF [Silvibacterium bohemicum]
MNSPIQLRNYDNSWYLSGRSKAWRIAWIFAGLPFFRCSLLPFSSLRVGLLRLFGARIGARVVIHSEVTVKYPWHLTIGDDCWIGERAWIDNLTAVCLGNNVCISQGVYLCTGNHDWSDPAFGLKIAPIFLHDGAWAAAMCRLLPGAILHEGAIAAAGSVIAGEVPAWEIFSGNPAAFVRRRHVHDVTHADREARMVAS